MEDRLLRKPPGSDTADVQQAKALIADTIARYETDSPKMQGKIVGVFGGPEEFGNKMMYCESPSQLCARPPLHIHTHTPGTHTHVPEHSNCRCCTFVVWGPHLDVVPCCVCMLMC